MAGGNESLVGEVVDERYVIEGPLGQGAMGVVYRARHLRLQRRAALKVLHDEHGRNEVLVERFLREARAASQVSHPNVVPIYDFGQLASGQPYMAMELREVPTLADRIQESGGLEAHRALAIARTIADALACVHLSGIIHRDLKPDNIAIGDADHVTVLDFGIAKVAGGGRLTATGEVVGTPLYMSPEQCRGDDVDARTDVYALGAILYEMLTGEPPFHGRSIVAIVSAHLMDPPPDARQLAPGLPAPIAELVSRCLAKDRERRPASMAELRDDLERLLVQGEAETIYPPVAGELAVPRTLAGLVSEPTAPMTPQRRAAPDVGDARGPRVTPETPADAAPSLESARPSRAPWVAALGLGVALGLAGVAWFVASRDQAAVTEAVTPAVDPLPAPPPRVEPSEPSHVGAASAPEPAPRQITITSEPPGAEIADATGALGVTPLTLAVGERRDLRVHLEGYEPAVLELSEETEDAPRVRLVPIEVEEPAPRPVGRRGPRAGRGRRSGGDEARPTNPDVQDPWAR